MQEQAAQNCDHLIGDFRGLISQSFFAGAGDEHLTLERYMQKFAYCPICGEKL